MASGSYACPAQKLVNKNNQMKKSYTILVLLLGVVGLGGILMFSSKAAVGMALPATSYDDSDNTQKVFRRNSLQKEGMRLAKKGKFDLALAKYEEAMQPENVNYEYEKAVAIGAMREIYKWKKEYAKALELQNWYFKNSRGGHPTEKAKEERREIEALIEYEQTGNPKQVYDMIEYLRRNNKNTLPPIAYPFSAATTISNILRLYDTIGDYDAGIAFIDDCLAYFKEQDRKKYGEYKPGKTDQEFLKVREAFEKDKAEGTKGRATQALIQSDYFPW